MITREELTKAKIFPIIVEDYVKDLLNMNFPDVEVLDSKFGAGDVVALMDPVKFRVIVLDEVAQHLADEVWVEIDGFFYSRYELMCYIGLAD